MICFCSNDVPSHSVFLCCFSLFRRRSWIFLKTQTSEKRVSELKSLISVSYFFPLSLTDRHKRTVSVSASHGLEKTCCHQPPQPFYLCQRLYKYDVQHVYVTKMIPEGGGYSHCCTHTTLNAEYSGKHRLRIWLNLELKPFI